MSHVSRIRLLASVLAAVALVAGSATYAAAAGSSDSSSRKVVVKTARSSTLGKTILVTLKGRSLYSLSEETHGRFICTDPFCLSLWTPLVVPRATTPAGARSLGTVRRPDGRRQVTYRGLPLYTFTYDRKPGDVQGNGFGDVGTWRVATVTRDSNPAPPASGV